MGGCGEAHACKAAAAFVSSRSPSSSSTMPTYCCVCVQDARQMQAIMHFKADFERSKSTARVVVARKKRKETTKRKPRAEERTRRAELSQNQCLLLLAQFWNFEGKRQILCSKHMQEHLSVSFDQQRRLARLAAKRNVEAITTMVAPSKARPQKSARTTLRLWPRSWNSYRIMYVAPTLLSDQSSLIMLREHIFLISYMFCFSFADTSRTNEGRCPRL